MLNTTRGHPPGRSVKAKNGFQGALFQALSWSHHPNHPHPKKGEGPRRFKIRVKLRLKNFWSHLKNKNSRSRKNAKMSNIFQKLPESYTMKWIKKEGGIPELLTDVLKRP